QATNCAEVRRLKVRRRTVRPGWWQRLAKRRRDKGGTHRSRGAIQSRTRNSPWVRDSERRRRERGVEVASPTGSRSGTAKRQATPTTKAPESGAANAEGVSGVWKLLRRPGREAARCF